MSETTPKPAAWRRILVFGVLGLLGLYVLLVLAAGIAKWLRLDPYMPGDLMTVANIVFAIILLGGIAAYILRATGAIPDFTPEQTKALAASRAQFGRSRRVFFFAFWIVVALILVFAFNLLQGTQH